MANAKGQRPSATESTSSYTMYFVYDVNGNIEYACKADIGTATSASGWQIKKMTWDVNNNVTNIEWADATDAHDKIADSYISYSYS